VKIRKPVTTCLLIAALTLSHLAAAGEPIRLDASSDSAAEASYKRMVDQLGAKKQRKLQLAILQINMTGVNSAYEVASNPELQRVGPARIKDRIAGMTAEEIIDFADRNSTVTLEVKSH
jgi:hypothetical protein